MSSKFCIYLSACFHYLFCNYNYCTHLSVTVFVRLLSLILYSVQYLSLPMPICSQSYCISVSPTIPASYFYLFILYLNCPYLLDYSVFYLNSPLPIFQFSSICLYSFSVCHFLCVTICRIILLSISSPHSQSATVVNIFLFVFFFCMLLPQSDNLLNY